MEAQVILENCRIESEANPAIAKVNIYDGVIKAYFAEFDRTHQTTYGEIEECYRISDYKRKLCRELIAELEKESFGGVAGIINALNARMVFLIDTPAYIAEQISAHKTDIKAEYEHFRKWTKADFDFTKAVFEQLKGDTALCRTLANELLSAAKKSIKDDGKFQPYKRMLEEYLNQSSIDTLEDEKPEPRKAGRPKGVQTKQFKEWLQPPYKRTHKAITDLARRYVTSSAPEAAIFIKALCDLGILIMGNNDKSSFYRTLKADFMVGYADNTFSEQYRQEKFENKSKEIGIIRNQIKAILKL